MTGKSDRLSALMANAELLRDYNTHTGVLPSSKLNETLKAVKAQEPMDYYSEEASNLRDEVFRIITVIKPTALSELQNFFPYTSNKKTRGSLVDWIFPTLFAVFSIILLLGCAKYTLWSKEATQFMNEVQTEQNQLASDRFTEVLNRWDVMPALLNSMGIETQAPARTGSADDFRVFNEYHQKYTDFVIRQRQLERDFRPAPVLAPVVRDFWQASFGRNEPIVPQKDKDGKPPKVGTVGPAPDNADTPPSRGLSPAPLVSDDGSQTTERPSPVMPEGTEPSTGGDAIQITRTGGGIGAAPSRSVGSYEKAPGSQTNPQAGDSSGYEAPKGFSYLREEAGCLSKLEDLIKTSQNEVPGAAASWSTDVQGEKGPMLVDQTHASAWMAIRAREINMRAFQCFFNVPQDQLASANSMRTFYLSAIRDIRNRLDILNSWVLPGIYGALGAVMLTLRAYVNPLLPRPTTSRTIIRVLLGSFVGVVIGWFWSPQSSEFFEFANISLGLFTMAFLFGYGNDVFFSILERVVGAVAGAIEHAGNKT